MHIGKMLAHRKRLAHTKMSAHTSLSSLAPMRKGYVLSLSHSCSVHPCSFLKVRLCLCNQALFSLSLSLEPCLMCKGYVIAPSLSFSFRFSQFLFIYPGSALPVQVRKRLRIHNMLRTQNMLQHTRTCSHLGRCLRTGRPIAHRKNACT